MEAVHIPIQSLRVGLIPILASTYTAHVVTPYTKASGKQLTAAQQYRSQRRAQARGRLFGHEGEDGGDEAKVAIADYCGRRVGRGEEGEGGEG